MYSRDWYLRVCAVWCRSKYKTWSRGFKSGTDCWSPTLTTRWQYLPILTHLTMLPHVGSVTSFSALSTRGSAACKYNLHNVQSTPRQYFQFLPNVLCYIHSVSAIQGFVCNPFNVHILTLHVCTVFTLYILVLIPFIFFYISYSPYT